MDRRELLLATGATLVATMAGCLDTVRAPGINGNDAGGDFDPPDIPEDTLRELAWENAVFALDVFRELATEYDDNIFLSPYSISAALAMTYAGAAGPTAEEMEEVLGFHDGVHEQFAGLEGAFDERQQTERQNNDEDETVDAFTLRSANALWGRTGTPFAEAFLDLVEQYYRAGLTELDFSGDPEGSREHINAWVADRTEDRIDEVLPPGSIDPSTVLVLTNAIYFMASWLHEFDPSETEDGDFTTADGSVTTVPFMQQDLRTPYAEVEGARAVELPYVGEEVSMVCILPEKGTFQEYLASLEAAQVFHIFEALGDYEGTLELPKFEIEMDAELGEMLADLGMPTSFAPGADFSEMFENGGGVWIDEVYHDAFVTIDEEGTEAAASTAVVMVESAPPHWGTLRFDRSFIFCIRDRPTDSILFLGTLTDPS